MDNRFCKQFYRVGDACCMFRTALSCGRQDEALFWADELFSSGCVAELNQILFEVWLFYKGMSDCKWLLLWYRSDHDYNDVMCNTIRLCWTIHDGWDLRVFLEAIAPGPTPNLKVAEKVPSKLRTTVFSILGRFGNIQNIGTGIGAFWRLALRVGGLKLRPYRNIEATDFNISKIQLVVQPSALYGLSERGQMSENQTTIEEVRGDIVSKLRVSGSPYWIEQFVEYNHDDDDLVEEFYAKHFPRDIPDEWSLESQMRSHGTGSLINSESSASIVKLLRKLFRDSEEISGLFPVLSDKKIPHGTRTLFDIVNIFTLPLDIKMVALENTFSDMVIV